MNGKNRFLKITDNLELLLLHLRTLGPIELDETSLLFVGPESVTAQL